MEIIQLVGVGVAAAILILIVRDTRPEVALILSLTAGALILLMSLSRLSGVLATMGSLAARVNLTGGYLSIIVRVIGVAYLAEFGVQLCKDAGAGSVAAKVELGGKLIILALSAPIVASLVEMVVGILQ